MTWGLILCSDADVSLEMVLSKSVNLPLLGGGKKKKKKKESKQTLVALLFNSGIVSEFHEPGYCSAKWKKQDCMLKSESSELCLKLKLNSDLTAPAFITL